MLYCPVCETYWLRDEWKMDSYDIVTQMGYIVYEVCGDCLEEIEQERRMTDGVVHFVQPSPDTY